MGIVRGSMLLTVLAGYCLLAMSSFYSLKHYRAAGAMANKERVRMPFPTQSSLGTRATRETLLQTEKARHTTTQRLQDPACQYGSPHK